MDPVGRSGVLWKAARAVAMGTAIELPESGGFLQNQAFVPETAHDNGRET